MATIEFDRVTKAYAGGVVAVDGLELTVADGEFMIFVGPSGCGKTTALRMVAGLERITSGTVSIGGRVVNDVSPRQRDLYCLRKQRAANARQYSVEDRDGELIGRMNLREIDWFARTAVLA